MTITQPLPTAPTVTRAQQVEALLDQLRPKLEAAARRLLDRALDVPDAQEFGPIDLEFRDAGLGLANDIRLVDQAHAALAEHREDAVGA